MARALSSQKILHKLTGVFFLKDTATTGAVDAIAAKGDTSFDVGTGEGASFAEGDELRIGSNGDQAEVVKVASVANDTITVELPLTRALAAAEVVTKLEAVNLGKPTEDGISPSITGSETKVSAGTQIGAYLYIPGEVEQGLSLSLRDFEKENIAVALGIDETDSTIVGTNGIAIANADIAGESSKPWKITGLLEDLTTVTWYQFAAKVAAPDVTLRMAYGFATEIPIALRCVGGFSTLFEAA